MYGQQQPKSYPIEYDPEGPRPYLGDYRDGSPAYVPRTHLRRHAVIFGGSGYGKTVAMTALEYDQLATGNCSLVAIDAKMKAVRRLRDICHEVGVPSHRVWTLSALEPARAPRLNPLAAGDPAECAALLMEIMEASGSLTGPNMEQYLRYAMMAASWHGLKLSDVPRLLSDAKFRISTFAGPARFDTNDKLYRRVRQFFAERFQHGDARGKNSAEAAESKFDQLLANRLFLEMFDADENDLNLASLFHEPGAVLVHAGKGGGSTRTDRQLLSGIIVGTLAELAASGQTGPVPVILAVDEAGMQSKTIAEPLSDIVNLTREAGIRMLLAAQHPDQLPEGFRKDLKESTAVKIFFRPGGDSAGDTARLLERAPQIPVPPPYRGKLFSLHSNGSVEPLRSTWPAPIEEMVLEPDRMIDQLHEFASYDRYACDPILLDDYRDAPDTFARFPPGSVRLRWREGYAWAEAQVPATDWGTELTSLGVGEALVMIGNAPPAFVRVSNIEIGTAPDDYGWRRPDCGPDAPYDDEDDEEDEDDDGSFE